MPEDGYPTEDELQRIRAWDAHDPSGLLEFVRGCWTWADTHFKQEGNAYTLSTGGWSGNEDLLAALQQNAVFWLLCWKSSHRGGRFEFEIPNLGLRIGG